MNNIRFFQELCHRAVPLNLLYEGPGENNTIYFSHYDMPLCHISSDGVISYFPEHLNTEEKKAIYRQLEDISEEVKIYVRAMEEAPPLKAVDLRDGYKLLCEHENIVLAGKDMGEHGYQFVTWQYTYDRKGVTLGHYYHNNYAGAKEEFAVRSGLIDKHKLFEPEELKEIYLLLDQGPQYIPDLTYDQERRMMGLREKLERIAPKAGADYRTELAELQEKISDELLEENAQKEVTCSPDYGSSLSIQNI